MHYFLKHKDIIIAEFTMERNRVTKGYFYKETISKLPLPLKRLIKDRQKEEFVNRETEFIFELNEDGCFLFDQWISNREIPVNRENYSRYIAKQTTAREWLLKNNGYSFVDNYWIESEEENLCWNDILLKKSTLDTFCFVKDKNNQYKGHSATLGGQLEKFWFQKDDCIYLFKKTNPSDDILIIREYLASVIYKTQDYHDYCEYKLIFNKDEQVIGCVCKNFIKDGQELITAYDLLEEYNLTQSPNAWELIIQKAKDYDLLSKTTQNYLDMQTLVDFLITNRDRHQNNIAFIRDEQTGFIIKPAPIFDNGSSAYMESKIPETLYNTTVNGLFETELECLKHVSNFNLLDVSKLPNEEKLLNILNLCSFLSESRKEFLVQRYQEKIEFIKELQREYNNGTNMSDYINSIIIKNKENYDIKDDIIQIFDDDFFQL